MKKFKGVLFDFDGVIAPPTVNLLAWKQVMQKYGIKLLDIDWYRHEGRGPGFIAQAFIDQYNLQGVTADEIKNEKSTIAHDLIKQISVKPYPGVEKIIKYLKKKKIMTGIVTGSARARLEASIPELFPLFDTTVTVDDKIDGRNIREKPDPEPFLVGVTKLSLSPDQCWVVENAPLGIQAAKAGGLFCIALMTTLDRTALKNAGADKVFKSHATLYRYFQKHVE